MWEVKFWLSLHQFFVYGHKKFRGDVSAADSAKMMRQFSKRSTVSYRRYHSECEMVSILVFFNAVVSCAAIGSAVIKFGKVN